MGDVVEHRPQRLGQTVGGQQLLFFLQADGQHRSHEVDLVERVLVLRDHLHQTGLSLRIHQLENLPCLLKNRPMQRLRLGTRVGRLRQHAIMRAQERLFRLGPQQLHPLNTVHQDVHRPLSSLELLDHGARGDRKQILQAGIFSVFLLLAGNQQDLVLRDGRRLYRGHRGGASHHQWHHQLWEEDVVLQRQDRQSARSRRQPLSN
jgi:hypothetical protein